mmetsp:Transcript_29969/g.44255  ORF Transcript_29969/g.44255 Transcript_29969/m.44255 type:complete len:246 (-) Transcript_29969:121-858(-)
MNSSFRVRSNTNSSTNSCRNMATRKSWEDFTTSPVVGCNSPAMIRSCVVFPAPFCPTNPIRSPVWTPQVTSFNTSCSRKTIPTCSNRKLLYPGCADSITRMRGGGRSFRIFSSNVFGAASPSVSGVASGIFFLSIAACAASTSSASKDISSGSCPISSALAFFLASFLASFAANFSSFFLRALSSFLDNLGCCCCSLPLDAAASSASAFASNSINFCNLASFGLSVGALLASGCSSCCCCCLPFF